ncbi:MAG: hypothetical protein H7Y00_10565 [Fimbriimonadaceae bacterium]|nr:hypothetical protein [Chitinophagales bacterium]
MRFNLLYIIIIICVFTSCIERNNFPSSDNYNARITIHEPVEGDVVSSNSSILLKTTFENDEKIQNIELVVINNTSGDTLYYINKDVNADFFYFVNEEIFIDAEPGDQLQLISTTWHKDAEIKTLETVFFSAD